MLRIKQSVSASYSQVHFILPEYLMQGGSGNASLEEAVDTLKRAGVPEDEMAALERQIAPPRSPLKEGMRSLGFVSGGVEGQKAVAPGTKPNLNPADIDLGDDFEDEEEEEAEGADVAIAQKAVPDEVYGELAGRARELNVTVEAGDQKRESDAEEPKGALERFKRQKR